MKTYEQDFEQWIQDEGSYVNRSEVATSRDVWLAAAEKYAPKLNNSDVSYDRPTPETDDFMAMINDSEIDLDQVRTKMSDLECERDSAREYAPKSGYQLVPNAPGWWWRISTPVKVEFVHGKSCGLFYWKEGFEDWNPVENDAFWCGRCQEPQLPKEDA